MQVQRRKSEKKIGFRVYNVTPEVAKEPKLPPNFINNAFNLKEETEAFINYREVKQT